MVNRNRPSYQFNHGLSLVFKNNIIVCFLSFQLIFVSNISVKANDYPYINFEHITVQDGLVHDHVLCINQDSKGFIWIGTFGGLQRYDGIKFKLFPHSVENENSISQNAVHAIFEDAKRNVLWIGTEGGLDKFDLLHEKFTHFLHNPNDINSISHNNVRSIWSSGDSILWIGTYGGGLNKFKIETGEWEHFQHKTGDNTSLCSDLINTVYVDNLHRMWIGTEAGGLSLFDPVTGKFRNYTPSQGSNNTICDEVVNSLLLDHHGILWICTWNGGVCSFNPETETFKNYPVIPDSKVAIRNSTVRSVIEDSQGNLWFATLGGGLSLYSRESDSFTSFINSTKNHNSLSINFLWSLFEDRNGLIWVGTFGGGIDIFNSKRRDYQNYFYDENNACSLSSNLILTTCQSHDGTVWVGTEGGGLNKLDRKSGKFTHFLQNTDPKKALIRKIFEDSRGLLWIGSDKGLYQFNPKTLKTIVYSHDRDNPESLSNNSVFSIGEDKYGSIWVGIWNDGLNKIEPAEIFKSNGGQAKFVHFKNDTANKKSLSNNMIWAIYTDRLGTMWVCNDLCLEKFDDKTGNFQHVSYNNYTSILEDTKGNLWLGSLGGGITKFEREQGTVTNFKSGSTIDYNNVIGMIMDKEGIIWIGTPNGVAKFNPASKEFTSLNLSVELQANEFNIISMETLSTGEIIFGGKYGISIIDPKFMIQDDLMPEPEFTGVYILDEQVPIGPWKDNKTILQQSISYSDKLKLPYKFFLVRFDFAALYYLSKNKIQYAYMLDGYDKKWNYVMGYNPVAIYNKLPNGNYTLRVKTSIQNNNWSKERTLDLEIASPIYKTRWFRIGVILLIFGLFSVLYLRQLKNIKLREIKKYLEDKHEKEDEINRLTHEKLDNELELKKKELASFTLNNIRKNEKLLKLKDELLLIMKISLPKNKSRIEELIKEIESNMDDTGNWEYFEHNFNLLHDDFLVRFASKYPKLTHKDLKICAFIRMNIDNKGIAKFLHITTESLGVSRTRIRKKIDLDKDIFLNDFIIRF
jgi:ligand-binding sensor domain-containing protein